MRGAAEGHHALLLLCLLCGCNHPSPLPPAAGEAVGPTSAASPASPGGGANPTEVVVVATQHYITDMPEGYSPAHLRALLEKIAPHVLAVEVPANVPDPWSLAPFFLELQNVTLPWAKERRVELVPAGWHEPLYQFQLGQMFQQFQASGKSSEYERLEQEFQQKSNAQPLTCQFMNSAAYHQLWRDYHAGLHRLLEADTPWETWNTKVLAQVVECCRKHPGQRVAVVFGGAHGYFLEDHLAKDPRLKVLRAESFLPLTEEEIESETKPADYLKALRPLNFPGIAPVQLAQVKPFLEKVKEMADYERDYWLFHGKYLLRSGAAAEALEEFERLMTLDRGVLSRFDGESQLHEMGHVHSAIALIQLGDLTKARARLQAVIDDPQATGATRQWAQQVLDTIPPESSR